MSAKTKAAEASRRKAQQRSDFLGGLGFFLIGILALAGLFGFCLGIYGSANSNATASWVGWSLFALALLVFMVAMMSGDD